MKQEAVQIAENEYVFTDPTPTHFTVYRDGEVDHDYYKEQARRERAERLASIGKGIVSAVGRAGAVLGREVAHVAMEVGREIDMTWYDAQHGTQYRKQYHERRRASQNQEFAQRLGLTAMR